MTAPTKTPIDPSEIRAGDLIRFEFSGIVGRANEYIATGRETPTRQPGQHFLLGRLRPYVDLPSTPTLGWIATDSGSTEARFWRYEDGRMVDDRGHRVIEEVITEFTLATAVPADALDRFMRVRNTPGFTLGDINEASRIFLAAVDEATS